MSIAPYIKVIGRGKDGARPLSAEQADDLLSQVLDGQVTDLEIGAFCLAMRIKGETPEELDGFVQATLRRCVPLTAASARVPGSRGTVVLPSYNGARKLPNFTPLLAALLARRGVAVLVHGPAADPTRVTTAEVWRTLGWARAQNEDALAAAWAAAQPAFIDTETLCPALAKLLAVRWTIGLRNPGHTVAKLLDPFAASGRPAMRVVNHTHPEYAHSLTGYLQRVRANALLMRGTEGEPVADARRQPRFEVFLEGERDEALSRSPQEGVLSALPELPEGYAADVTAAHIDAMLAGRVAVPDAITAQVDCLVAALARQTER